jgi:hypothetical protein
MYRVRIKKLPNKAMGGPKTGQQTSTGALSIQPTAMGGSDIDQYIGEKALDVKKTLQPEAREESNVEVEKGEVVGGDLNGDGMLETYVAGGKRHSQGGTPLNLPDDTFIWSDTSSMRIKDPEMLAKFGKTTGSYTPAQLAKQYDVNKYRKILQDPNSDSIDKKTAELMIRNYTMKLGGLALAQEAKKGFPQGIPMISQPYLKSNGVSEEQILPTYQPKFAKEGDEMESEEGMGEPQEEVAYDESMPTEMPNGEPIAMSPEMEEGQMAQYGMSMGGFDMPFYSSYTNDTPEYAYGGMVKAQNGIEIGGIPPYDMNEAYSPKGVVRLNAFRKKYGLPQLKGELTKEDIKAAAGELQSKIAESNPNLLVDYMTTKSHQPNRELLKIIPAGYPKTTAGVKKALADGKLTADKIRTAYKDNEWWYRALDTNVKELTKSEFEKKLKDPNAIKQGDKLFFNDDPNNPELYTEYVMREEEPKADETKKQEVVNTPGQRPSLDNPFQQQQQPGFTPLMWSPQDLRNLYGAQKLKSSYRKYMPYAPGVDLAEATPTFVDPTRELAALSEAQNLEAMYANQYMNPQLASARSAFRQAATAKGAADVLSRYWDKNADTKNQFEMYNAGINTQERLKNNEIAKQLYNENVIANQSSDNFKRQADELIRQYKNTGEDNALKLALTNAMSDQYDIIPGKGLVFTGGKKIKPEVNQRLSERAGQLRSQGWKDELAVKMAEKEVLGATSPGVDYDALLKNYTLKNGGGIYVMGANVFPFMFY